MRIPCLRFGASVAALLGLLSVQTTAQTFTKVDIAPPLADPGPGSYTQGVGGAFTITGWGTGFYPNMTFSADDPDAMNRTGDVMTFAYGEVTGDFDRRVKITSISTDPADPVDPWAHGGLMVRTSTKHYSASLQLLAANPATGGQNQVRFVGRALDGQNYGQFSRDYAGVAKALPNQWLRLRRVGDYFAAYVGTNGVDWTLVGERYQEWPAKLLVGCYAAGATEGTQATVKFSDYSAPPLNDSLPPRLVSAGTLDKKMVGVKFSEMVSAATATVKANYKLSQGTISDVKMGIGGDSVYLSVSGLSADTFTVTVLGGVQDTAGNTIAANSVVEARALNWNAVDIGQIQNPNNRPTVGDDPYRVGRSVMVSSDENPEIEVVGGGSNQWNPGDFIHYIHRVEPLSGDFDVTVAVSRFDRSIPQGGYSNSGIMLRARPYREGMEYTAEGSKVPMVANPTYIENSAPGRGAIPLWRVTDGGGYGNGNAGFSWQTVIGGIKGYYPALRGIDASGNVDAQSSPNSARYLRILRRGNVYTFYASWDGIDWAQVDRATLDLPDKLLLGFSTMTDSGAFATPFSAYANNGHMIDPDDPLNPLPDTTSQSYMNESNYAVQRIKVFPNGVPVPVPVDLEIVDVKTSDSIALPGSYTSTGTYSFDMTGGGTGTFRNLPSPQDGTTGGDELTFAYETIDGDFDKQIRVTSLTSSLFWQDGTAYVPAEGEVPPVDAWARAGLMVRADTNAYNACLKIVAANPEGANEVRVMGRGIDAQNYTIFSRSYAGVKDNLPNQWLRLQRVGDAFNFYVSKDGAYWSMIGQRYQVMPKKVQVGAYVAAALDPYNTTANPNGLLAKTAAKFADYKTVDLGDKVPPALVSVGTLDKKTVGVKFSEPVGSATATVAANYKLSQGTVTAAKMGIGGDTVYLSVNGLNANAFTVTVSGVKDPSGNTIEANSSASGKVTSWVSQDVGFIQDLNARPTVGDDPYRVGQAVAISSDDNTEVEIIGGGSNAWNSGDFLHYLYQPGHLVGDFDVAVAVKRYDRSANQGGYSNSGVMLRALPYNAGEEGTADGTKVPMVANTTYLENSGPGRGAIPLWRTDVHGGYGNGAAGYSWTTLIGGIKGYYGALRATDAAGTIDPQSSASSARWLRVKREGTVFHFYASWDGVTWDNYDNADLGALAGPLLFGLSTMTDSGASNPPYSAYGGNGHTIDPLDPLNPANAGGNIMNDANYAAQRVQLFPKGPPSGPPGPLSIALQGDGKVSVSWQGTGNLLWGSSVNGPWDVVPGANSPYVVTPTAAATYYRLSR